MKKNGLLNWRLSLTLVVILLLVSACNLSVPDLTEDLSSQNIVVTPVIVGTVMVPTPIPSPTFAQFPTQAGVVCPQMTVQSWGATHYSIQGEVGYADPQRSRFLIPFDRVIKLHNGQVIALWNGESTTARSLGVSSKAVCDY